jgi:hypothetical protein
MPVRRCHSIQLAPKKASLPLRSANAPYRGTQLHPRCVVNAYATGASLSDA